MVVRRKNPLKQGLRPYIIWGDTHSVYGCKKKESIKTRIETRKKHLHHRGKPWDVRRKNPLKQGLRHRSSLTRSFRNLRCKKKESIKTRIETM